MTDSEALDLAWEMLIAKEPDTLDIRSGTEDDKEFAAYRLQCQNLKLKPWQHPPCNLECEERVRDCDRQAFKILQRLLLAGISAYHPDPLAAIAHK